MDRSRTTAKDPKLDCFPAGTLRFVYFRGNLGLDAEQVWATREEVLLSGMDKCEKGEDMGHKGNSDLNA